MDASIPKELPARYLMAQADEPIVLYRGDMELIQDRRSWQGTGTVRYEWLPWNRLAVAFRTPDTANWIELRAAVLALKDLNTETEIEVLHVPFPFPAPEQSIEASANVVAPGADTPCALVRFHFPNLQNWLGDVVQNNGGGWSRKRFGLHHAEWSIALDATVTSEDEFRALASGGGGRLTHVGTISRRDEAPFTLVEAQPMLDCLGHFLSFCRGAWTQPILLTAETASGEVVGWHWSAGHVDRYRSTISWLPTTTPVGTAMQSAFTGFADRWFKELWQDPLRTIVQWYVEGSSGAMEKSVILLHAALELLAWVYLVKDQKSMSESQWGKPRFPFWEKLQNLLSLYSIPPEIPSSLPSLATYCADRSLSNGPHAFGHIRNSLVHPRSEGRRQLRERYGTLSECWLLGGWYLDLCILRLCGYSGEYFDRTVCEGWMIDAIKPVPWA